MLKQSSTKSGMETCRAWQVPIAEGMVAKKIGLFDKGGALPPMTPGEWAGCSGYRGIPVASAAARAMQERRLTAEGLSWDTPSSSKARAVSDVN